MNEGQMPQPQLPPDPPQKRAAGDVLGSGKRPGPKRFSRKVVTSVAMVALGGAAVALVYGLFHQPNTKLPANQANQQATNGNAVPFGNLQNTYTPKQVNAPIPPVQVKTTTIVARSSADTGQTESRQLTDAQKQALAAQNSGLFFKRDDNQGGGGTGTASYTLAAATATSTSEAASPNPVYGAGGGASGDPATAAANANNTFLASQSSVTADTYAPPLQSPISPYEVQAGSVIPAALITKSISDLPGDLTAQVTENVYDSATGKYLLIPQGSRLFGRYSSLIAYGQTRSLIVWNRLILPNGKSMSLGGMIGTDAEGASGMTGDVNRHNLSFAGALAVASLLSVGPAFASDLQSTNGNNNTILTYPAQYASNEGQSIGEQLVAKELSRPNTITILSGQPLDVLVNKDLVLQPYKQ